MSILFLFVSIIVVFLSKILFKNAFGDIGINRYLPHTHLYFFQLILFSLVGANLMIFGFRTSVISSFVQHETTYIYSLLAVYYAIILIPISIIIFNHIFKFNIGKNLPSFINRETEVYNKELSKYFFILFSFFTILSIFVVLYLSYYKAPLYMYLTGQLDRVLTSRIAYSRNFQGSLFIKNVIGQSIIPLMTYILFAFYRITKNKSWRLLFFINFFCAVFISGSDLSKSGIVYYLIPYIYLMTVIDNKIPLKKIVKYGSIVFAILVFMYTIQYANAGLTYTDVIFDFYSGPIGRILLVQVQAFPAYLEIFPEYNSLLLGKSIAVLRFLGLPFIESARIVAEYIEPIGVQAGNVGVANTIFMGDAYANFGLLGLIISPIWLSFVFSFFYYRFINSRKSPINIGYYIFILDNLTNSLTGGFFSAYVINTRIIAAIFFMFFIKFSVQMLTRSANSI